MRRGTTGCCATMKIVKSESPGAYVTESVSRGHFCFSVPPPVLWWLSSGEEWDAIGKKAATAENKGAGVKYMG